MQHARPFYLTLFSNASQKLYPNNTISAFTSNLPQPIDLGSSEHWEVGLCELTCPPPNIGVFAKNLPVVIGSDTAFIYCDLIAPQVVGDSLVRCLRTYIFPSLDCQYHFKNVYYVPLEKSVTPVKIVLHFRPVFPHI